MKRLLLIRHAKAVHDHPNDFERRLTLSGMQDAMLMAQRVHAQNIQPQIIISSPAIRALTTANIFAEHLSLPAPRLNELIYDAKRGDLLRVINNLPDNQDFIALAGHNPDISQTIEDLTGEYRDVPPCAVALIDFEAESWPEVVLNSGSLIYYSEPAHH